MARTGAWDIQISFGVAGPVEAMLMQALDDAQNLFPNSMHAIGAIAQAAQERWISYASGELTLPNGKTLNRRTGQYAESIHISVEDASGDAFVRYVVSSNDPKAHWIEEGTPAWDMKKLLQTSHKVRLSEKGDRYLIIPLRFGSADSLVVGAYSGRAMPKPVQTWWLKRDASFITGSHDEPSLLDPEVSVSRLTYRWGDRLTARDVEELGLDPDDGPGHHMVGMVKMGHPENKRHNQFMTFRVMSENSPAGSWQHPGTPAYAPAEATYQWVMQQSTEILEQAMSADVERLQSLANS